MVESWGTPSPSTSGGHRSVCISRVAMQGWPRIVLATTSTPPSQQLITKTGSDSHLAAIQRLAALCCDKRVYSRMLHIHFHLYVQGSECSTATSPLRFASWAFSRIPLRQLLDLTATGSVSRLSLAILSTFSYLGGRREGIPYHS